MSGIDKFLSFLSVLAFIAGIAGIVCFYCGVVAVTCSCAVFLLFESFMQVVCGEQNGFGTQIFAAIVGFVVALISQTSVPHTIAVALCFEAVLNTLLALPVIISASKDSRRW